PDWLPRQTRRPCGNSCLEASIPGVCKIKFDICPPLRYSDTWHVVERRAAWDRNGGWPASWGRWLRAVPESRPGAMPDRDKRTDGHRLEVVECPRPEEKIWRHSLRRRNDGSMDHLGWIPLTFHLPPS